MRNFNYGDGNLTIPLYLWFLLFLILTATKSYAQTDTVLIFPETKDTISYSKVELKGIIDTFPGLINEKPDDPDISYLNRLCSLTNKPDYDFSSEVGKDEYYMLIF